MVARDALPIVSDGAPQSSALELTLRVLRPMLADPTVTELCINRPGEGFIERSGGPQAGWTRIDLPFATYEWCHRLARLVATSTRQRIDEESALLSAGLPDGERIQVVLPPACLQGTVAISIRRPAERSWSLSELAAHGSFAQAKSASLAASNQSSDGALHAQLAAGDLVGFVRAAVLARKNILVSGATGSGKTTFTRALIGEIPAAERLITIEDAAELDLSTHPNSVRLFYSKDGQGQARVTPRRLLESCLRMRPDRILLSELRGEEAFDYLRNACSGHPGSITSIHAASCALAFEQLALLVKQNPAGRELSRGEIQDLLRQVVDVIVQFGIHDGRRVVREVWFEPAGRVGSGRDR